MKDLSREEKLEQEISRMAYEYGDKRWERVKRTFFVILGAIYLLEIPFALAGGLGNIGIDIVCGLVFAPLVVAGFIMYISYFVLSYIINGSLEEEKALAKKMGELNAIKYGKYVEYEEERAKETKKELEDLIEFLKEIDDEYKYILDEENEEPKKQLEDLKSLFKFLHRYYEVVSNGMAK